MTQKRVIRSSKLGKKCRNNHRRALTLLWLDSISVPNDRTQRGALDTTAWLENLSTTPWTALLRHCANSYSRLHGTWRAPTRIINTLLCLRGSGHEGRKGSEKRRATAYSHSIVSEKPLPSSHEGSTGVSSQSSNVTSMSVM